MKQKLLLLCTIAIITIVFTSCEKEPDELKHYTTETSGPIPEPEGFNQLVVNTPGSVTLGDSMNFTFEWATGDTFAVYEVDGEWAANFKINDAAATVKSFTALNDARLDDDKYYIALYPAPKSGEEGNYEDYIESASISGVIQNQDGVTCSHLKSNCYMSVTFKGDDPITFDFESAFLAINFEVEAGITPSSLKFLDGSKEYSVNFENIAAAATDNDVYTAYIAIDPATTASRTQQIFVPADADIPLRTIENYTYSYSSGEGYTASTFVVENYNELVLYMPDAISEEVDYTWSSGDKVSLYNAISKEWVADCSLASADESKFIIDGDATIDNKNSYIAVYPAREDAEATYDAYLAAAKVKVAMQNQKGDNSSDHLKIECWLCSEFKGGEAATFEHKNAIVKLSFSMDPTQTPNALNFIDGLNNYTLTLEGVQGGTSYTAFMAVEPNDIVGREQSLEVVYGDASQKYNRVCSDIYTVGTISTASTNDMVSASITQITTAADLIEYLKDPSSDAILLEDVNLIDETSYIPESYLSKEFNGNGKKISNLTITSSGNDIALFKGLNSGGVIKNLTMVNPKVKGAQYAGSIVGKIMEGGSVIECKVIGGEIEVTNNIAGGIAGQSLGSIEGCSFEGSIIAAKGNIGGIIGVGSKAPDSIDDSYVANVTDCIVNANIKSSGENTGGIVGKSTSLSILGCSFSGSISGVKNIGGIAGFNITTTIKSCVNSGKITASNINVGGIAGNTDGSIVIEGCTNSGDINSTSNAVGGILGISAIQGNASGIATSVIIGCSNSGNIEGVNKVAGVIGSLTNGGSLIACYNSGNITGNSNSSSTGKPVSGVIAEAKVNSTIVGCYNTGVTASTLSGYTALQTLGNPVGTSFISDCYYVNNKSFGSDKGIKCDNIEALNGKVELMNKAINATSYKSYIFVVGADAASNAPTIIKAN